MRKILIYLGIILLILILFEFYIYLNLLISEKYEVEVAGIPDIDPKVVQLRSNEILADKKQTIREIIILSSLLIVVILYYNIRSIKKSNRSNTIS